MSSNNYRHYNSVLPKLLLNQLKKLVTQAVARISQAQSIRDTWMRIAAVKSRKPDKLFVKSSTGRTFKNDMNENDYYP